MLRFVLTRTHVPALALAAVLVAGGVVAALGLIASQPVVAVVGLALHGLGTGATIAVRSAAFSDVFGGANFGTIFGLLAVAYPVGGALAVYLGAVAFDATGSYFLLIPVVLVAVVLVPLAGLGALGRYWWTALALPLVALLASPPVLNRLLGVALRLARRAPLPQRLVIIGPIRHASLRPRNMAAAVGIVFVRHDGGIRSIETGRPLRHPAYPCNTLTRRKTHPILDPQPVKNSAGHTLPNTAPPIF